MNELEKRTDVSKSSATPCYANVDEYLWETEYPLATNMESMGDFLENHLDDSFDVIMIDGTYSEIEDKNKNKFALHAAGDGDFTHHKIKFIAI